jgi:hypothetical protein
MAGKSPKVTEMYYPNKGTPTPWSEAFKLLAAGGHILAVDSTTGRTAAYCAGSGHLRGRHSLLRRGCVD